MENFIVIANLFYYYCLSASQPSTSRPRRPNRVETTARAVRLLSCGGNIGTSELVGKQTRKTCRFRRNRMTTVRFGCFRLAVFVWPYRVRRDICRSVPFGRSFRYKARCSSGKIKRIPRWRKTIASFECQFEKQPLSGGKISKYCRNQRVWERGEEQRNCHSTI